MDPLPIPTALSKLIDPRLLHRQPIRHAELLADELADVRNRESRHALPPSLGSSTAAYHDFSKSSVHDRTVDQLGADVVQLHEMSARELKDIGLTRSPIERGG